MDREDVMQHGKVLAAIAILVANSAFAQTFPSETGSIMAETVARGLDHPWGLAFLPDGRMLVSERPGRMRIVSRDGSLSQPLAGVPKVLVEKQGGLLDVILDRILSLTARSISAFPKRSMRAAWSCSHCARKRPA